MIKRVINVNGYWKIIVYYNVNYNLFDYIVEDLKAISSPVEKIDRVYYNMTHFAKAVTISSFKDKTSVVLFNIHKNKYDYINSIVHEAEHVKQDMLDYYAVEDVGEPPAYTVGYLVMKMLELNMMKKLKYKKY